MTGYYLGLISGTSVDGVDAALCRFGRRECTIAAARTFAYPPAIRQRIESMIAARRGALAEIGALDVAIGRYFADCAVALIREAGLGADDVTAIGHHGQTIWHEPDPPEPFSWQLGDPSSVAAITGIDTVTDFRRLDMALGGQGAPMVSAFHEWLFADETSSRIVVNIGGIANVTVLVADRDTLGFDTGPGNTLLDHWIRTSQGAAFDDAGRWAASGKVDERLLDGLLDEAYFTKPAPKSTGRELFNESWLAQKLGSAGRSLTDADVQATLLELTAATIVNAIVTLDLADYALIVCGGGAKNDALLERLASRSGKPVTTTLDHGVDPDWVEAALFAWLARARLQGSFGNRPTVTGARQGAVLGAIYLGVKSEHE
jgi:anhydro-N-acetylmuramic acid kinase